MAKSHKIAICFPARNEQRYLPEVLEAIRNQTLQPVKVYMVNDGSTDRTEEIAVSFGVTVINREKREYSVVGKVEMAKVFNDALAPALEYDKKEGLDFVVIIGADTKLPPEYLEELCSKFDEDESLMIASGRQLGKNADRSTGFMVPGAGRMIRFWYWKKLGGAFPLLEGWEAYPVYRAQLDGYRTKVFPDIGYTLLRPTGGRTDFYAYGRAMRAYGYFFPVAVGRSLKLVVTRGPKAAANMLRGFLFGRAEHYEEEIRKFVNKSQRRRLRKLIFRF